MDRKGLYLAAVVSAFMLLVSICLGQENQIINGEFDDGIEHWQRSPGDGYTIDVVQDANLSGPNALKIDVLDAAAQESITIFQGGFTLDLGAKCHIGFKAKADADRQIGLLFEYNNVWADTWHKWIDLTTLPKTFTFEFMNNHRNTEGIELYFILKHLWFPLINEDENIDVYIDDIYVVQEPPADPNLAHYPWPSDEAIHKDTWVVLSWSPGRYATSHDIYFGEDFNDVNDGADDVFCGNYDEPYFLLFPGCTGWPGLMPGTTYYWRIDEVNDLHPDSPWRGDVWSFWLPPYTAYDPVPADGAEMIDPNVTLS
jgi:hypothetical protein